MDTVEEYPLMKFTGGIEEIHTARADANEWMENLGVRLKLNLCQRKKENHKLTKYY